MTSYQKEQLIKLRGQGLGYGEIGEIVGVTTASVKQFFYRQRNGSARLRCDQCNKVIEQSSRPTQRFCSYECRMKWWKRHPREYSGDEKHCFTCKTCGVVFYRRKPCVFCSRDCYFESRRLTA